MRPVCLLATGGTIAMAGPQAVPALDAEALAAAVPGLGDVRTEALLGLPGAHLSLDDALAIARRAARLAAAGEGVVVTGGTDTLEEVAVLCDLLHAGDAPVVLTGAIRPASAPGADGPANLLDAVAAARSEAAAGLGALLVFAGRVHAARDVRKVDSTGAEAFGSPRTGPIGTVLEGRVRIDVRPRRRAAVVPERLDARVPVVPVVLGDDGRALRALAADADGVVVVALGAGHVPPPVLHAIADLDVPVVLTVRPERGAVLHGTYGFEGAEGDLRRLGVVPAGALSPQAARVKLLAALGAGLEPALAFAGDDA